MNLQYKTGYPYAVSNVSYPSIGLPMFPNGYPDINTSIVKYIPQEPNTRLKDYFRIDLNYTMEKKLKHGSRIWQFSLLNVTGHIEWMNQAAVTHLGQLSQLPEVLQEASTSNDISIIRIEQNGIVLEMAISCTTFVTQGAFATQSKKQRLISLKNIHSVLERNEMEAWQKLIRVLTHEIMNSITPIISLSETLSERGIPESLGEKEYSIMLQAMQTIHRRSKGLLGFVENYRRLTRIPTPVRTKVSVAELFTDLKKLFPEEYIHFEMPASDLYLYADRAQIEQVLINLLKNARETCERKADKEIQIKFFSKGNPTLAISDNGEGILPTVLDKIFVPFFTTKTSGSGIGLSLCKQIMALHDGSINVKSELGKGSCFVLTFPK